ncbi:hypothetical protein GCM10022248_64820 [Nonomuraea soli]
MRGLGASAEQQEDGREERGPGAHGGDGTGLLDALSVHAGKGGEAPAGHENGPGPEPGAVLAIACQPP